MFEIETWLLITIIFYCLVAIGMSFYVFAMRKASVFEPISQFIFFFSLFVLPLPIRAFITLEIEGDVTPNLPLILPYIPVAVLFAAIGLPLFTIGYYSTFPRVISKYIPHPPKISNGDKSIFSFLFLTAISASLIYLLVKELGGFLNFLLLGYGS